MFILRQYFLWFCDWKDIWLFCGATNKTLWRGSLTNLFHLKRCQLRWKLLQSWLISNRKLKLRIIVIRPLLLRQTLWTLPCRRNNPNPNNSSISTRNLINNYTNKITAGYDIYFNVAKWVIESNTWSCFGLFSTKKLRINLKFWVRCQLQTFQFSFIVKPSMISTPPQPLLMSLFQNISSYLQLLEKPPRNRINIHELC